MLIKHSVNVHTIGWSSVGGKLENSDYTLQGSGI